jgi:NADPH-dependent ferric siderophore reductase
MSTNTTDAAAQPPAPARRVQRVRHELKRRQAEVLRVERLGPGFAAITFGGEDFADFNSLSYDDHVKFIFAGADGEPVRRDYTPRRFDAARRELTIEFALHGHGPAAAWAQQAAPGQQVTIGGPRGSMIVPLDYEWHLLVADAAGLPAIARRLEELRATTRAIVIAQVDDPADRRPLSSQAGLQVQWVATAQEMVAAVAALRLPAGEGYAWCAGEAADMARLRQVLLVDKGHPREAARIAAYWKRGAQEFHENLE